MTEIYLGSKEDQNYIRGYLENIRQLYPIELFTLPQQVSLEEISKSQGNNLIDGDLFWQLVNKAKNTLQADYHKHFFEVIDPTRYFFGISEKQNAIGGFHSKWSVGYHYFYHAGFVVVLNPVRVQDVRVRTIEAVRSYLHDSLHHSTFRSFRRVILEPKTREEAKYSVPRVYREQYGFNFRDSTGLSYSEKGLTTLVPRAINLNLLMDGITVILATRLIKNQITLLNNLSSFDDVILKEVIGELFHIPDYGHAQKFFDSVVRPSQMFIDHWGGEAFLKIAFTAMMTGELNPLKSYFNQRYGEEGAWEKVFKRPEFKI